ncbi:aerotaxis receptor [Leucobacter luti]|nr:aerotaxis receptor [Leucobacter luti]
MSSAARLAVLTVGAEESTAMAHQAAPTGEIHEVGIADIFFSTTDRRGVIEHANDLFVSFSRFERVELIGSPHAMMRHPDMPGAVFHEMWAALLAGRPFAGHVTNLAADGSTYSVYATVTPLSTGGFLSVRIRPMDETQAAMARDLYRDLLAFETGLRAVGVTRRAAAERGAAKFTELLSVAGFPSLTALQQHTLPREVAKFERRSDPLPHRPDATGEVAELLATVTEVDTVLSSSSLQQRHLATLSTSLQSVGSQLQRELEATSRNIGQITALAGSSTAPPDLFEPLTIWAQMQGLIQSYTVDLIAVLRRLDENSAEHRFRVALAKLHTRMMASFVIERIDAPDRQKTQTTAISLLAESLRLGLTEMNEHAVAHRALTAETVAAITKSASVLAIPRELLVNWNQQLAGIELSPEMQRLAHDVTESITQLGETLAELQGVVSLCGRVGAESDAEELLGLVARIDPVRAPRH